MNKTIGFIGGGNMARSIIGGLVSSGIPGTQFRVSDPSPEQRSRLEEISGVKAFDSNADCLDQCDIVVMAVKPQVMKEALSSVDSLLQASKPLIISIAAGILIQDMVRWIGAPLPVIRVMPNTPALVNCGVSGLFANELADQQHKDTAQAIMQAVGPAVWVNRESDIDTVTGISGSGPAYFFKLMEIMISAAQTHGLDPESARTLVLQTALGAARLANESDVEPGELRRQVTSPKGTTEAAINAMEDEGIENAVTAGIQAAIDRSEELARILGDG
jgi:pyrroline-5-carboxylate reductase